MFHVSHVANSEWTHEKHQRKRRRFSFYYFGGARIEAKDLRRLGMFQSCIRRSRSCFGITSRYLRVLWFILSGKRNNYEEEIVITSGRNKEEIIIISPKCTLPKRLVSLANYPASSPGRFSLVKRPGDEVGKRQFAGIKSTAKAGRKILLFINVGSLEKRSNQPKY